MSSILETFAILFTTNSEEVAAGQAKVTAAGEHTAASLVKAGDAGETMGQKIAESSKLGKFEISELDKFAKRFAYDFIRQTAEMATGLAGFLAVEKLVDGFFENAEMVSALGDMSKALGVNVSDLDAWDQAVIKTGGTAQDFQESVTKLNRGLAGVAIGSGTQGAKKVFADLGISATDANGKIRPVFDLLPELADRLSKMSSNAATGVGMKLGLDEHTILLLHEGRQAVDDMIAHEKELGVVTQQNVEAAQAWNEQWADFKDVMRGGGLSALDDILPALTAVAGALTRTIEFLEEHKTLVEGFFIGLSAVILTVYGPAMASAAIATIAATWPILLIIAALGLLIAAFALAYDDIANFIEGNNSLLGVWLTKWLGPNGPAAVREILKHLGQDFVDLGKIIGAEIDYMITQWDKFISALQDVEKLPSNLLKKLGLGSEPAPPPGPAAPVLPTEPDGRAGITQVAPLLSHRAWADRFPGVPYGDVADARAQALPPLAPTPKQQLQAAVAAGQQHLAAADTPLASIGPGVLTAHQGNTITNNNSITATATVNTQATDAKGVAGVVNDTLSDHIAHTIGHFADGVQS